MLILDRLQFYFAQRAFKIFKRTTVNNRVSVGCWQVLGALDLDDFRFIGQLFFTRNQESPRSINRTTVNRLLVVCFEGPPLLQLLVLQLAILNAEVFNKSLLFYSSSSNKRPRIAHKSQHKSATYFCLFSFAFHLYFQSTQS